MHPIFKTAILSLFFLTVQLTVQHNDLNAEPVNYVEKMTEIQKKAKTQADTHATELTRLQLLFNKEKKPKKHPILTGSKKYKKKYRTVAADLKELNQALRDGINELLAPLPSTPTETHFLRYRDSLISFGNNATRTLKALRDEMKWLKGEKKATFEIFDNYDAANTFLLKK